MQVAAVARVPPAMLQFIVAPELEGVGDGMSDVPGLEGMSADEGGRWVVWWWHSGNAGRKKEVYR